MGSGDWNEALRRWESILDRFGPKSSWSAHRGIIVAYREQGNLAEAEAAANRAVTSLPESVDLAAIHADLPTVSSDWSEAVARGERLIDRFGVSVPANAWSTLAVAHERMGDSDAAERVLHGGRELKPDDTDILLASAELSMVRRMWPEATRRWNAVLQASSSSPPTVNREILFPRRGTSWDWYEEAWQAIARQWDAVIPELHIEPDPDLYRTIGRVLLDADLPEDGLAILHAGLVLHPENAQLALEYVTAHLEHRRSRDLPVEIERLGEILSDHPVVSAYCSGPPPPTNLLSPSTGPSDLDFVSDIRASNREILSQFGPNESESADELGRILTIRTQRSSSVALELRAGRYFSQSIIEQRVREISDRDAWPETTASTDLSLQRARELADKFGRRFADPPRLGAEDLSDTVLLLVLHELAVYEPMRRLAQDIASRDDRSPVFIEATTDEYRYLDDYPFSNFDVLYLYFELRSLEVNAFLCRYHDEGLPGSTSVSFVPGVRALLPSKEVATNDRSSRPSALIPAGIRSVAGVIADIGSPLVLTSGSVLQEFAYDRTIRQHLSFEPEASIHPPSTTLPTYTISTQPIATLRGPDLWTGQEVPDAAIIEVSEAIGGDWLTWLDRVLHKYLASIAKNSEAIIAERGIKEAHVCDHLFADSALFASAVKRTGGRVVLWPHSANPVHVDQRRPETFDEVHAVTRSGCDEWRRSFPSATVVHSPSAMLNQPAQNALIDPTLPLSVVVIAGRSVLRYMPLLDRGGLEASYRAFFSGVEDLQKHHPINLYFKPRGHTGEHEMWLTEVMGSTGNWRRVLEHPLRIDLPNMLFVSIGMGSSALIEGLSRGVPGLVVRDFPVRDYTTLSDDTFPTKTTPQALSTVEACTEPGEYELLLGGELDYYAAEISTDPVR